MLRYIVGIAIAYGIGKWIYQSIRSRSIDYFLLAIIALMGAVLWLSRGFLISNRVYDFLMIVVWLVAVGCFIISRKSQYGKYLKFATVGGLSTFLVLFVYWNVKAESIKPTTLTTQLRGYSTSRIVEVCFRYNETPFWRSYNLNQYPNVKLLPEQYDVRVTIKPISANVAKLESIMLIPKNRKWSSGRKFGVYNLWNHIENLICFERNIFLCSIDEMPRKHIKAECSNKNGWQFVTSKSDNPPNVLIIKG